MAHRPIKTSFEHIPLVTWFPPSDEVAISMARLCILREDLYIEINGLREHPLSILDENSMGYRQIYFFRSLLRTLLEISGAIRKIRSDKVFMTEVYKSHPKMESELDRITDAFNETHDQVKTRRNEMGGHVLHNAIRDGLSKISVDTQGLLQTGTSPNTIHYKFSAEFIGATMLRHVPAASAQEEWDGIFSKTVWLGFDALSGIDILFQSYVTVRGLPRR